jgi:hypothetical protein
MRRGCLGLVWLLSVASASAEDVSRPIEATGDPRLDGILSNITWRSSTLTFAFPDTPFSRQPADTEFKPLDEAQRHVERAVLKEIENFTLLKFEEVKDAETADLTFARWQHESRLGRVDAQVATSGKSFTTIAGQTWVSKRDAALQDQKLDGESFHFWRHETGHILGLEHPHNNFARFPAPIELDNVSVTVMSYRLSKFGPPFYGRENQQFPASYMPLDIYALQHLYGANFSTNAGDTIYKFTPKSGVLFETIWDGGGKDTLDFSDYTENGLFDIRPGGYSTPSQLQLALFKGGGGNAEGSVAMPMLPKGDRRALIENITVGNGNNTITLNHADNVVRLGSGKNRLIILPGTGFDIIEGFDGDDCVDISNYRTTPYFVQLNAGSIKFTQWPKDFILIASGEKPPLCAETQEPAPEDIVNATSMSQQEIERLKKELSSVPNGVLTEKFEALWKDNDFEASFALASFAYEKFQARQAAYRLGIAYFRGFGVEKDIERAFEYLSVPQLEGARYAHYFRGRILADPSFSGHDLAAAKAEFESALELGVKEAGKALLSMELGTIAEEASTNP